VPRLLRIGLTSQQLEALCDSRMRRPLPAVDDIRRFLRFADVQMQEVGVPDLCPEGCACQLTASRSNIYSLPIGTRTQDISFVIGMAHTSPSSGTRQRILTASPATAVHAWSCRTW
jgi:hypothetical protein